jgi:glycosyltransferase involved in cell wall biosynthesis
MKLILATPLYPPEIGGPATYARELAEGLPTKGIEVELVKFSDVRNRFKLVRHYAYLRLLLRVVRHADLILVQDTVSCGLPALIAAHLRRIPLVVRVPGDYAWEQGCQRFGVTDSIDAFQTKRYGFGVSVLRFIQRWVVRNAARVIVPSHYFAGIVRQWGVRPDLLSVIYNGIRVPLPAGAVIHTPPAPFVVSVGRLVPWKGFRGLIQAMKGLPAWHLVIIGDGPERRVLESFAREIGVSERVVFIGRVSNAEVIAWYRAATAFALNTSFESFSFQIAEALAAGVPVIATRIGSIPELVEDGKEGILVEPDDVASFIRVLESVRTEPEKWRVRTEAAQKKAERFSKETMLTNTVKLLADCAPRLRSKVL